MPSTAPLAAGAALLLLHLIAAPALAAPLATGAGAGGGAHVQVFDTATGGLISGLAGSFLAYPPGFIGGAHITLCDFNGDGVPDIVIGAGPTGDPHVRTIDGVTGADRPGVIGSFYAFPLGLLGGVFVACADVNGDGVPDVIVGAGPGSTPQVRVVDGITGVQLPGPIGSFLAYDAAFRGGVRVAACDLNGDGIADIITGAGPGSAPHVRVFDGATGAERLSFFAYATAFTGGVFVACGDVNGDGIPDIITSADAGGAPHVRAFDGKTGLPLPGPLGSFLAHDAGFRGGATVAACDFNLLL